MILLMSLSQFITQRQLMLKNLPADAAKNNPYLQQQKILLYVFPIMFAVFGVNFPVGVLLYWLVSNFWTMGQQFYVIRRNPTPGSVAYDALEKRRAAKAVKKGSVPKEKQGSVPEPSRPANGGEPITVTTGAAAGGGTDGAGADTQARRPARNQPQRASRSQRSGKKKRKR